MEQATLTKPGERAYGYTPDEARQHATTTLLPVTREAPVDTLGPILRPLQPRDGAEGLDHDSATAPALGVEHLPVDEPSWPMNAENEMEFAALADRLQGYAPSDLPARFGSLVTGMIIPALNGVAERMKVLGYECSIESFVDAPMPSTGQAVYFTFDTRYAAGENSLCIRLAPGESVIRVETPVAGSVITQHIPLPEFAGDNVQRVALDFMKRVLQ